MRGLGILLLICLGGQLALVWGRAPTGQGVFVRSNPEPAEAFLPDQNQLALNPVTGEYESVRWILVGRTPGPLNVPAGRPVTLELRHPGFRSRAIEIRPEQLVTRGPARVFTQTVTLVSETWTAALGAWLRSWPFLPPAGLALAWLFALHLRTQREARRREREEEELASGQVGPGMRLGDYVLEDELGRGGMATVYRARRGDSVVALKAGLRCDAVNVGINLGPAAGGSQADHLHVHCVPRWTGDANFISVAAETRVLPISLDQAWEQLRTVWPESQLT